MEIVPSKRAVVLRDVSSKSFQISYNQALAIESCTLSTSSRSLEFCMADFYNTSLL